jgi:hypothetical protein
LCRSDYELARGTPDEEKRKAEMCEASEKLKEHLRMDIRKELPLFFPPKTAVPPPVVFDTQDVLMTPPNRAPPIREQATVQTLNDFNPATLCSPQETPDETWDDNWYGSCTCVCMFARIDQFLVQPHLARQCLCVFSF